MSRCLVIIVSLLFFFGGDGLVRAESPITKTKSKISRAKTLAYSKRIDALVAEKLKDSKQSRNRPTDDTTFARRAYLSVVGRIPNIDELNRFLDSKSAQKRSCLLYTSDAADE